MAEERDEEEFGGTEGDAGGQQPKDQQGQQAGGGIGQPFSSQGSLETGGSTVEQHQGQSAYRPQDKSGGGQSDLGTQAGTTLSGRSDQQDLSGNEGGTIDQPGSFGGGVSSRQSENQGEGFIGAQGTGTDEYPQEDQQDFAREGQGAAQDTQPSDSSDIERDGERSQNRDSDTEGSSGNK